MRWPIHIQILLPTLSVVVVAIVLTAGVGAWSSAAGVNRQQEQRLGRVVETLTEAAFPLTETVLRQMSGLSGAEFVLLDRTGRIQSATRAVDAASMRTLKEVRYRREIMSLAESPAVILGGRSYLAARVPVVRNGGGSLVVLYREDHWQAAAGQAAYPAILVGAVAAAGATGVTTLLARRFVRPIRKLGDHTARIAAGEFQPAPLRHRQDELGDLAESIDRMTEQLSRYEEEVRRNERLRTLGQLGAGLAHQLRNAATGALMAVEFHRDECPAGHGSESLDVAARQLKLMETYLKRFLALGRPSVAAVEKLDIGSLVEEVLALVRPACRHARIELDFVQSCKALQVLAERTALEQVIVNLVHNAMEAVASHGAAPARIVVEIGRENGRASLRVQDNGPGPAADTAERLFEPFVTDKPDGTGLGLAVARQMVEQCNGSIRWDRRDSMTVFTVELPLLEQ